MATLGELKARIASELNRDDLTSDIATAITRAIEFYAARRFWFNEATQTVSTVAGQNYVALPTGIRIEDTVEVTVGGFTYQLTKRPLAQMEAWLGASPGSGGQPTDYATLGSTFKLYPVPTAIYTITATGVFDLAALGDDDASNAWTTTAEDLINARAKYTINRNIIRDFDAATADQADAAEALKALVRESTMRLSTGRIAAA